MPVVPFAVQAGYRVEARDGELGTIAELFNGPARSLFVGEEQYLLVTDQGQPDLFIPLSEVVDVSDLKRTAYLKRWMREIDSLSWTRDPRLPAGRQVPYHPRPRVEGTNAAGQRVLTAPDGQVVVTPRPRIALGTWQPANSAPRPEPGRPVRIGDRFKPGDRIPQPGQYMCTVCWQRKHTRQFLESNPDGRFPPAHHPGGLWELEDLRP